MLDILSVVNLQHFVTVMVDDLDGELAGLRRVEGAAGGGTKLVAITISVFLTVGFSLDQIDMRFQRCHPNRQ